MQQAGYHHAHMLAEQLKTDMARRDQELMTVIQSVVDSNTSVGTPPTMVSSDMSSFTPSQQQVNAAQTYPMQLEMMKLTPPVFK